MNKHGEISFSWVNDVFTLEVKRAFNEEALEYYIPLIQKSVSNRSVQDWKRLEVWDDEVLGSPTTAALTKLLWEWYDKNGCVLTGIVVSNSVQAQGIQNILKSKAKVFINIGKAQSWLERHNRQINQDKEQLFFSPALLILTNYYLPITWALAIT
ncbi:hypothetical protein [Colwellia psychrerythraea]|uniref:STAS/SEC14 domain-containing protein n=1 Tax=Colwellia psychrerythraea TaxID=28229 RepID=A0A099KL72_COLPS|nr:hypothetical protein [Colwellia psychrerythraea]KGJ91005.1 hypothetical protein GAB14E_0669 [Colwellia psychrerythraea]